MKEQPKGPPQEVVEWYWRISRNVFRSIVCFICTGNHPTHFTSLDRVVAEHPGLYIPTRTIDKLFGPYLGVDSGSPYWIIEIGGYWHTHTDRLNELLELADLFVANN